DAVAPDFRPTNRQMSTVHLAFDVMVAASVVLLAVSGWFGVAWRRRHDLPPSRWFLRAVAACGVLAVVALECGWVVTEVGRQPWTVVGFLLTRDAVTTTGNLWWSFTAVLVVYTAMGIGTVWVLRTMGAHWRERDGDDARRDRGGGQGDRVPVPYGPPEPARLPAPPGSSSGSKRSWSRVRTR
ncbi:MAG: cytochrome bd ubiquinol oxidase subunit, partial [Acidimicrobiia bacterium]|nr:cytochrome bd ubiquinol oxidase subunit [Acidimicrobiia bacterium]